MDGQTLHFGEFLGVCGHHMKVCGRTPSKDEEHMKNTKNTMSLGLDSDVLPETSWLMEVIHVFEALRVFFGQDF